MPGDRRLARAEVPVDAATGDERDQDRRQSEPRARHTGAPRTECAWWAGDRRQRGDLAGAHPVDVHRAGDVFEPLLAGIVEGELKLASRILLHASRHADAAWLGKTLQARRHVDVVAENIVLLDDDVPLVNPDPELDALLRRHLGVPLGHASL